MAEQIPFNVIADVLTKLGSSAIQQIGSAFGVTKELTKLTKKLATIKGVLVDAEKRKEESDAVKAWVRRLKDVVYDADDLLDDFATHQLQRGGVARQVSDFFSSSNQLVFRFKKSNRVKDIFEEVDEIVKEIPLLNLIQGNITHGEAESSWRETHSFALASEIVGRGENKEEIIKSLVSSDNQEILSMVAIVGIGGLGKTTLAQLVYNDKEVVQYFEPRIWVCVSENFDIKSLVKKILKEVCEQDVERLELNGLKNLLHEKLSQKRCLLVLDDVWNENSEKWDRLKSLLMVVGKGSKILVTTRHSKVASIMGIDSPFVLEGLKETQSWDLFAKMAFTEEPKKVHPKFVEIGKEIVNMCKGVPLVIKTLGTILHLKTEESHWLSIKNNTNLLSLGAGNDNVLSVLKLSYDNLPIYLKQCFAYCALFPKDHKIEKNMLVQLWMAQGYIQPLDEKVGDRYFDELLSRSLLEKSEYNMLCYKMHDLIHDLAQSVIGSEVLVLKDDVEKISKEVHHVSLFDPMHLELKALKAKHIRTFLSIPISSKYEHASIQGFSSFKCLRVLSLDKFLVKKVPKSLGNLSHLRYLDLSHNWFEVLPNSITRLKNLQTLKLVGCYKFKKFPKDLKELINLRHWENDECLSHMPCGIGELTWLQSLPVFVVGNGRGVGRLSELKGLNNLRGELSIVKLENARDVVVGSGEEILRAKQYIRSLKLQWGFSRAESGEDAESVLEGLRPHRNLEKLCIEGYGGRRFPSWMMNGSSPLLSKLEISICPKLTSLQLPPSPILSQLMIQNCDELASLELHSSPLLSKLEISICPKLTSLQLPPSPILSQLMIQNCDELASLELHSSPLLSKLCISYCSKLTSLLLPPSPLLSQLEIRKCNELASLELHSSPLLSKLWIYECCKLTSLLVPPSPLLSQLMIENCDELASLELHSSPLLSQLMIRKCDELASLKLHLSPPLSRLFISHCPKLTSLQVSSLPCLKTVKLHTVREEVLRQLMLATSSLESVSITSIDDLMSLPDELYQHVSTLQTLQIWDCSRLATLSHWIGNLTSLTDLVIGSCPQLTSFPEELRSLRILKSLTIQWWSGLTTLPDWIGSLSSLECLRIHSCPQLTSLPEEMRSLTTLQRLEIFHCPHLSERCQRENGEDWPKIAHVPDISIYCRLV